MQDQSDKFLGESSGDKGKALEWVKSKYTVARQANSLDFERFARYYKLFRNRQTIKNYLGLANLFVPEPYRIVRKKTAKLAGAIRKIEVTAQGPEFTQSAKIGTHLLNFLREKLNWKIHERTAIQESRIVGLSWLKLVWNVGKEEVDKPWKGFDLSFHTADEILVNPEAVVNDLFSGELRWTIHVYESDIETLKKNPNYDSVTLQLLEKQGGSSARTDRTQLEQSRLNFLHHNKIKDNKVKKHKIYEYWGKYNPQNPDGVTPTNALEQDYIIVIANSSVVLRMGPNPYTEILDCPIPFVPIMANPVGQELYPVGDIEPAESLFYELNDTRNQRMDTVTLNIDPPKIVLRGANIDEKDLVARRGWYIKSNLPNGVQFIPPDMQGVKAAIDEEQAIRGDIQQVTGVTDFAPGTDVQAGVSIDTARGAIIAKGEADVLTADEVDILKLSLRQLYRIALAYAQVFLDRQFTMRVVEQGVEQFYQVDKTMVQGNLDLDINMATLQDTTTEQNMVLMLFNQAKTVPGANIGRFFTDVLETFKDNVNIQEYYTPPQPQPPEPPKVSISLKGELNPVEADEIYKTIPGVDPKAADPLLRQDLREAMRGNLPEHHENMKKNMELQQMDQTMQQTQQDMEQLTTPQPNE